MAISKRLAEDAAMRYSVRPTGVQDLGRSEVVKCRTPDSSAKKLCLPFLPYVWGPST
jgi:hypothetical protein